MNRQVEDAYIVAATRLPVGKRGGALRHARPDDLLAAAIRAVMAQVPALDSAAIDDVIVGCAMPEAEQGMNVARIGLLLAGLPASVPGVTINRFCASGLQAVADAAARIRLGEADVMLAAGVESMSVMPQITGNKLAINPAVFAGGENVAIAYGMGLTAETVARQWQVTRADQDEFALRSHERALAAIAVGSFAAETTPFEIVERVPGADGQAAERRRTLDGDEGPRADTSLAALAKLRPSFAAQGSVTAGNSSQMSDGAAAVLLMSGKMLATLGMAPLARFAGYAVAGVPPAVMGIGPVEAIPKLLRQTGVALGDIDWIELNEAFAAQALAVMRTLALDPAKVNPLGGAIALGHPLGATGAIRTATVVHALQRERLRYGLVSMCVGTGMGAAGLFERV